MATHEQTYFGAVLDELVAEGYITLSDDTNSYEVADLLTERARERGVVIDADVACDDCRLEHETLSPA